MKENTTKAALAAALGALCAYGVQLLVPVLVLVDSSRATLPADSMWNLSGATGATASEYCGALSRSCTSWPPSCAGGCSTGGTAGGTGGAAGLESSAFCFAASPEKNIASSTKPTRAKSAYPKTAQPQVSHIHQTAKIIKNHLIIVLIAPPPTPPAWRCPLQGPPVALPQRPRPQ